MAPREDAITIYLYHLIAVPLVVHRTAIRAANAIQARAGHNGDYRRLYQHYINGVSRCAFL